MTEHTLAVPPTDTERLDYVRGPQHRWFFWLHAVAFTGTAISLLGFASMRWWTLIFLVPLVCYAGETLLSLRTSTWRRRIDMADHLATVQNWSPERYPSVDVFLPTAGEDVELLENTYRYVDTIAYRGRVRVYVLDDAGRPEVERLAARWGFEYFARPTHELKKAGNLRYAFDRSDGDQILILDADFVPRPDILTDLVPYTDDASVGIVQSPQYFPTPKKMGWIERAAGATQEMFYRFIQPSRDAVGAAICVGTSALYRRTALEAMGGFPKIAHSEDVFTGFELLKIGYSTRYVPVNATQGICPDGIDPFITQQYRWCEGSMELLKSGELGRHPTVTTSQRLSFWSGFFYYLSTAMNVFFAPIPLLVMVWVFPQSVHPVDMLPLVGVLSLWLVVYPMVMRSRWRLDVVRVQIIYGFTHAKAIADVFFGKPAAWVPSHGTNRATPLAVTVKRLMAGYLGSTVGLTLVGIAVRLAEPQYTVADWWALIAFVAVNLYVYAPVVLTSAGTLLADARTDRRERRQLAVTPAGFPAGAPVLAPATAPLPRGALLPELLVPNTVAVVREPDGVPEPVLSTTNGESGR